MDSEAYLQEMVRLLSDSDTYTPLAMDPTLTLKKELKKLVEKGFHMGILNKKENKHLVPLASRLPTMFSLPKIHNNMVNPAGRPIISGIDYITSRVSNYVDYYLQSLVMGTPHSLGTLNTLLMF